MSYIVRIPEPCSEDWNKMTPEPAGRHCSVCSKTVIDFSNKTDNEVHSIIMENQGKNLCGHFRKSQIDRPMKLTIPFHLIPRNISSTRSFAIAVFIAFGTLLFSCTTATDQPLGMIELQNKEIVMGDVEAPREDTVIVDSLKTDTIEDIMIDGEMRIVEPMVNGGLGYYKEPIIETVLPEVKMETITETHPEMMLGGAIAYTTEETIPEQVTEVTETPDEKIIELTDQKENLNTIYPNPSNGEFNIRYEVTQKGIVHIDLFDISGKLVKNVVNNQIQNTGKYILPSELKGVANGIYICSITVNGKKTTERIVVEK